MPIPTQTRQPLPNLRAWRVYKGYSQGELAKRAGTAKSTVTNIETGKISPNFATLGKLADALEITREQLLHSTPDEVAERKKATRAKGS